MSDFEEFQGGVNLVQRRGNVVYRPASPAAPAIHRLLQHVHDQGFHGVPKPVGFDDQGRELLSFVEGEVPHPLEPPFRTPEILVSAATVLRRLHDATVGFRSVAEDRWAVPARSPVEVICHGDPANYNCVVQDGAVVGLIDFDGAHPGPRSWDLAYAVYRFAPLQAAENPESFGSPEEQGRRAALFCRSYGLPPDASVIDVVPDRLQALIDFMRDQAAQGNEAFQGHIEQGHADLYAADIRYVRTHREVLVRAFEVS